MKVGCEPRTGRQLDEKGLIVLWRDAATPGRREGLGRRRDRVRALVPELAKLRTKPAPARAPGRPGRDDPCPCGSGRKFKKCCLGKKPAA